MSEQIQRFADQAKKSVPHGLTPDKWIEVYNQKFAELIVRECVDICDKIYFENYPDAEDFERSEEGDAIKQRFGVKE